MNEQLHSLICSTLMRSGIIIGRIEAANALVAIFQPMIDKLTGDLNEAVAQGSHNLDLRDDLGKRYDAEQEKTKKLQKFKDFVHARFNKAGVPPDPFPEETTAHGCRIGGRIDWIETQLTEAHIVIGDLEEELREADEQVKTSDALLRDILEETARENQFGVRVDMPPSEKTIIKIRKLLGI